MCTSIVSNGKKTLVGWNLDLADMPYKVVAERDKVYIAVLDATEGWMPLFGANVCGDFVAIAEESRTHTPCGEQFLRLSPNLVLQDRHLASTRFD